MSPSCRRPYSVPPLRQQQQLSSKQPSSSMSSSKTSLCSEVIATVLTVDLVCAGHGLLCSLSDKLESKTQESRRISKEFEGAVAVQDAGMQTLEVWLLPALRPSALPILQCIVRSLQEDEPFPAYTWLNMLSMSRSFDIIVGITIILITIARGLLTITATWISSLSILHFMCMLCVLDASPMHVQQRGPMCP